MSEIDYYEFPYCMHAMASALHRENVDPGVIEIALPFGEWWQLWNAIERKFRGLMRFDGKQGTMPAHFHYMGFKFVVMK